MKERLILIRKTLGFTQKRMAESLGIKQSSYSLIESGRNGISDRIEILLSNRLGINREWFISGNGEMFRDTRKPSMISRVLEFIKFKEIELCDFATSIGLTDEYVYDIIFGSAIFTIEDLDKILTTYNLSYQWIVNGEGEMTRNEQASLPLFNNNTLEYKLVPLLNLDAVGGMHSSNLTSDITEYADKLIPFTDAQDGDVALMVSGESMSPTCPSGSKILIREVPKWNEYFGYGNIFVLLLTDGRRILKEVQKWQEDSKNYILCKSHNDKYPEEELPKSMIASVWKVIKILNERGW